MRYMATVDFHVTTGRGVLKINSGQTIDLPEDKARGLIDKGKIETISVKWDALSSFHLQVARTLAVGGVNFRLSTPEITQAEDALNKTWIDCLHGKATIDDFKAINEQWSEAVRAVNEKAKRVRLF